jgi:hypothetical protein
MNRNIRRRLQKLESQVPRQRTEQDKLWGWFHGLLFVATAYYVGDPTPDESIRDGYARALGYEPGSLEFDKALAAGDDDFNRRRREAGEKLFSKFGFTVKDFLDGNIPEGAFKLMEDGFSEHYKQYWRNFKKGLS